MENEIALNHFVSVENLTNDQILTLIHNANIDPQCRRI